jgi:hypothetical protein
MGVCRPRIRFFHGFASYIDSSKTIKCLYSNHILFWFFGYFSNFFLLDSLTHGDDKEVL